MEYKFLGESFDSGKLKEMSLNDKKTLCAEIRDKILKTVSQNGGHLASNLGTVELTVSLLSVFDKEKDKIVFDVGHQSYTYKLLTGRFKDFDTLRLKGGISGFPRIHESKYDAFDTGHSSTSISAAVGMARARDLKGEDSNIIAVIGDGAMTGGLAYEAMNDLGHRKTPMIIILNDNEMSIDPNVGGLSKYLSQLRVSSGYLSMKKDTESFLTKIPGLGKILIKMIIGIKDFFRFLLYRKRPSFFEDLGLLYYGPIDGHDIDALTKALAAVKGLRVPVLLHVITKKGKGYSFAEANPSNYHGVGPFDLEIGVKSSSRLTYTTAFAGALTEIAQKNGKVVAVCAAMAQGTGLDNFAMKFPSRFFDCGIAEEHCVTMAGGLSVSGFIPVVAIYSSFLQRAYDQIIHDVCFMNNHVIFAIDRAGLVGNDGHTHHGLNDISYMNSMPNMTLFAPRDYRDLRNILDYAVNCVEGPVAIRYPRGASPYESLEPLYRERDMCILPHMTDDYGDDFVLITIGTLSIRGEEAVRMLKKEGRYGKHISLSAVKPIPVEALVEMFGAARQIFTAEEGIMSGGAGEDIATQLDRHSTKTYKVHVFGIEDSMIRASSSEDQLHTAGLDAESLRQRISDNLSR